MKEPQLPRGQSHSWPCYCTLCSGPTSSFLHAQLRQYQLQKKKHQDALSQKLCAYMLEPNLQYFLQYASKIYIKYWCQRGLLSSEWDSFQPKLSSAVWVDFSADRKWRINVVLNPVASDPSYWETEFTAVTMFHLLLLLTAPSIQGNSTVILKAVIFPADSWRSQFQDISFRNKLF